MQVDNDGNECLRSLRENPQTVPGEGAISYLLAPTHVLLTIMPPLTTELDPVLPSAAVEAALGQTVRDALNLEDWGTGPGLADLLTRVQTAVTRSVQEEASLRDAIRSHVLSELHHFPDAPSSAGVYLITDHQLRAARRNLLLPGHVTACDGVCAGHDGLTATVVSVGVCLVKYDGSVNSWRSTFLRHDYDAHAVDPVGQLRAVLDRRGQREADDGTAPDPIHTLLRRGFMAAAERTALLERADSRWKIGHGVPAPLELLTGSGNMDLIDLTLPTLEQLLLNETRWVFLPATLSNRALLTVANALGPGELAIFQTGKPMVEAIIESATYSAGYRKKVEAFAAKLGANTVVGGYRATRYAPPQLFVAHADRAIEAGIVAMADGGMNPHRGFPLMLDLAAMGARTGLGLDAFQGVVEAAYAKARANHLFTDGRVVTEEK